MSGLSPFVDDRGASPCRRYLSMDLHRDCMDLLEQIAFDDAVRTECRRQLGRVLGYSAWQDLRQLADDELESVLDRVGPVLEELTEHFGSATIVDPTLDPDHDLRFERALARDPWYQPEWWPFDHSRNELEWMARRDRLEQALRLVCEDEQAEILAGMFHELRLGHTWSADVRWLLDTGHWFRTTMEIATPILEAEFVARGLLHPYEETSS